jgi:hypothetical protein
MSRSHRSVWILTILVLSGLALPVGGASAAPPGESEKGDASDLVSAAAVRAAVVKALGEPMQSPWPSDCVERDSKHWRLKEATFLASIAQKLENKEGDVQFFENSNKLRKFLIGKIRSICGDLGEDETAAVRKVVGARRAMLVRLDAIIQKWVIELHTHPPTSGPFSRDASALFPGGLGSPRPTPSVKSAPPARRSPPGGVSLLGAGSGAQD